MPSGKVPKTKIHPQSTDSEGRAVKGTVDPLTRLGLTGGQAANEATDTIKGIKTPGWEEESLVRAHLIHHGLGGKANKKNLTPTSRQTNNEMYLRAERPAMEALGLRGKTKGKPINRVLVYQTDVTYDDNDTKGRKDIAKKVTTTVKDKDAGTTLADWSRVNY